MKDLTPENTASGRWICVLTSARNNMDPEFPHSLRGARRILPMTDPLSTDSREDMKKREAQLQGNNFSERLGLIFASIPNRAF